MRLLKIMAFLALATAASASYATALTASQILTQFNAVVTGTFTSGHDVEGRVIANEITGGATFYTNPDGSTSTYGAVNANKIDNFNANINNGGKVDYQVSDAAHFNFNGGGSASQTPSFAMSDFATTLDALSAQLDAMTANSVVNAKDPNSFTFNLTPNASGVAVFDISSALLSTSRNIVFSDTSATNTIIINVSGSSFTDTTNFNANAFLDTHIIWNFEDATSLSFQGWNGTVLAGNASVTNSSAMNGTLYAKNFNGNGELHDDAFAGVLPTSNTPSAVPEPATYALFLSGLLLMLLAYRRRNSAAVRLPVLSQNMLQA